MHKFLLFSIFFSVSVAYDKGYAQDVPLVIKGDTSLIRIPSNAEIKQAKKDSLNKIHSPRKAAIRSAILPGLGQIYNKKYWKLPLVYGALGITAYVFFDNLTIYRDLRLAYRGKYNARVFKDSVDYFKIKPRYLPISEESIRFNRDQFRRNIDYSVLVFLLFWGINVIDATVDAHLKGFDINPDLSIKIKPGHSEMANTNGISLVFSIR